MVANALFLVLLQLILVRRVKLPYPMQYGNFVPKGPKKTWTDVSFIQWNIGTAMQPNRIMDISERFQRIDVLVLTGTKIRAFGLPHHSVETQYHFGVHSGWEDTDDIANSAAGVTIMLSKRKFTTKNIHSITVPKDKVARGRILALTVKRSRMAFRVYASYFPPFPRRYSREREGKRDFEHLVDDRDSRGIGSDIGIPGLRNFLPQRNVFQKEEEMIKFYHLIIFSLVINSNYKKILNLTFSYLKTFGRTILNQ